MSTWINYFLFLFATVCVYAQYSDLSSDFSVSPVLIFSWQLLALCTLAWLVWRQLTMVDKTDFVTRVGLLATAIVVAKVTRTMLE